MTGPVWVDSHCHLGWVGEGGDGTVEPAETAIAEARVVPRSIRFLDQLNLRRVGSET